LSTFFYSFYFFLFLITSNTTGNTDIKTIANTTTEKFFSTNGMFPKKEPADNKSVTQLTAPIKL